LFKRWAKPKPPDKRGRPASEKNEDQGDKGVLISFPCVSTDPNQRSDEKKDEGDFEWHNDYERAIYLEAIGPRTKSGGAKQESNYVPDHMNLLIVV
jgi:hypothetical protein